MNEQDKIVRRSLLETSVEAFDNLPILTRLEFVRNLLVINGGEFGSIPQDPVMVMAGEIVKGVIEVLAARPRTAKLRSPEPD